MQLQNSLELARQGHLFTKEASPKIYYRPYILLPEQKTLIEQQIALAQAHIDKKIEEGTTFQHRESVVEADNGNRQQESEPDEGQSSREGAEVTKEGSGE